MKLYLGNLPYQAKEDELQAWFAEAGVTVSNVNLVRDRLSGQPRGFGFAEVDDGEGERAIAALNGKPFLGRAVVVNEARPQGGGERRRREPGGGRGGYNRGGYGRGRR